MPLCASVYMCLVVTRCEKADLLDLVYGVLLWVCHFPIGILGHVWYLIVSIPDLFTLLTLLKIIAKIRARSPAHPFNNRAGIMSRPEAFRGLLFWLKLPHAFLADSKLIHSQIEKGSPSGSGMVLSESSCVNTDWYCPSLHFRRLYFIQYEPWSDCSLGASILIRVHSVCYHSKIVSEYDQEIPQS